MKTSTPPLPLAKLIECRILQSTHGRIRDLVVREEQGRLVARGHVPSHYTRQLALQGALEIVSGESFCAQITVGSSAPRT